MGKLRENLPSARPSILKIGQNMADILTSRRKNRVQASCGRLDGGRLGRAGRREAAPMPAPHRAAGWTAAGLGRGSACPTGQRPERQGGGLGESGCAGMASSKKRLGRTGFCAGRRLGSAGPAGCCRRASCHPVAAMQSRGSAGPAGCCRGLSFALAPQQGVVRFLQPPCPAAAACRSHWRRSRRHAVRSHAAAWQSVRLRAAAPRPRQVRPAAHLARQRGPV